MIVFRKSCDILFSEYANFEKDIIQSLADVERKTGVEIIWLKDFLCDLNKCKSKLKDTYVYRDEGHLSISGSELLLGKLVLTESGLMYTKID